MTPPAPLRSSLAALSFLVLTGLSACGGEVKEARAEAKPVTKHTCTIMVAQKSTEYRGTAHGDDAAKTEEAAWADVCAKLPEAERAGCKDEKKFSIAKSGGSANAGGATNYNTNITLVSLMPTVEGKAESETSKAEACTAALDKACAAVGEKGDCLAGGKFEKKGEISSSQTSMATSK